MKNPVRSNKGITLVELIVASAISVIIMAAACTMFYVGSKSAQQGATEFINHGDAYTLETQLRNNLFKARNAAVNTGADSMPAPDGDNNIVKVYFDSDKTLWVKTDSTDSAQKSSMADDNIKEFKLEKKVIRNAGGGTIGNIKPTVSYTITAETNKTTFELSGGITMNNVTDSSAFALHDTTVIENTDTDKYFVITVPRK